MSRGAAAVEADRLPFTGAAAGFIVNAMEQQPTSTRDNSLIVYMRGLTVAERLALNDAAVQAAKKLRAAVADRASDESSGR